MAFVAQVSNVAYRPPVYRKDGRIIDYFVASVTMNFILVCDPLFPINPK